jgi:precorrin-3B C17-methyltransferase
VVGIGPGSTLDRTKRAEQAIAESDVLVGYKRYLELISDIAHGKELISSGMTQEVERCKAAIECAFNGQTAALISSGDAGVYGMAGLTLELLAKEQQAVPVEICPGIPAANAASALLGAPLMLDYATISLSDLLVPWEDIKKRVRAAAEADFVVALYNPRSKKRRAQLDEAAEILRTYRNGSTPVGIATAVGSPDQSIVVTDLDRFLDEDITMRSIVIVGNSSSTILDGRFITPRGYRL